MIVIEIVVWVCAGVLAYAWVGYPIALRVIGRKRGTGFQPVAPEESDTGRMPVPRVSVLIAAHDEEGSIGKRLENLVECGMRNSELGIQIHVGLDGCTDGTKEIAETYAAKHANVQVHNFEQRRGKVAVLKEMVSRLRQDYGGQAGVRCQVSGEREPGKEVDGEPACAGATAGKRRTVNGERIFVFTDANTAFEKDALEKLLAPFADPAIGGVCGKLVLSDSNTPTLQHASSPSPEGLYWRMENWLKERESVVDSCLGANGAIYAIRAGLFPPDIPDNTIVDDFVIGMKVREQGYRVLYEPEAIAREDLPELKDEWTRRIRIGAGDYQALSLCRACLSLRFGRLAWMLWSHKVLRWFTPHLIGLSVVGSSLLVLFPSNTPLLHDSITPLLGLLPFGCLLAGALLGRWLPGVSWFRACDHFVAMQTALALGFLRYWTGDLRGHWQRTERREGDAHETHEKTRKGI